MPELAPPANDGRILISLIADMSGSMQPLADDVRGTINGFVQDQIDQPGEAFFTLTLFDTVVEVPFVATPVANVPAITEDIYRPRGGTALLDAVGKTIRATEDVIKTLKPDQVLFVIITDGQENSSKEWKREALSSLIKEKQSDATDPWQFVFTGANIDEWSDAYSLGGATMASNSFGFASSHAGMMTVSGALCSNTKVYRESKTKLVSNYFTQSTFETHEDKE